MYDNSRRDNLGTWVFGVWAMVIEGELKKGTPHFLWSTWFS